MLRSQTIGSEHRSLWHSAFSPKGQIPSVGFWCRSGCEVPRAESESLVVWNGIYSSNRLGRNCFKRNLIRPKRNTKRFHLTRFELRMCEVIRLGPEFETISSGEFATVHNATGNTFSIIHLANTHNEPNGLENRVPISRNTPFDTWIRRLACLSHLKSHRHEAFLRYAILHSSDQVPCPDHSVLCV